MFMWVKWKVLSSKEYYVFFLGNKCIAKSKCFQMVCPFPKMLISFIITKIVDIDMQVTNNMHGGYIITCKM